MIHHDFSAEASYCKGGDLNKCEKSKVKGTWQNYYDQALMVELENNLRFVANFKYEMKQSVVKDPMHASIALLDELVPDTEEATKEHFNSICDETMIGFVQDKKAKSSLT